MTPVSELVYFLPHRGEMIWIDYVITAKKNEGECLVILEKTKHYFTEDSLRQTTFIEWMAQGFGFVSALYNKQSKTKEVIEKAFLVAVEKMSFAEVMPVAGEEIIISVKHIRTVGPISYVAGRVYGKKSGESYSEATIKLFSSQAQLI